MHFYVNDKYHDQVFLDHCYREFEQHAVLGDCQGKRFTVCIDDTALWLALCLYAQIKGASIFPLPVGTPKEAARRRAQMSQSHFLLFGNQIDEVLTEIEAISERENDSEVVLVQMSSGTTGQVKCVERSWSSINTEIDSYIAHFRAVKAMTPVVACPISHSYGLISGVLVALKQGLAPVIVQNFNPKYITRKLREIDFPILYSSPTLITTITMMIHESTPLHAIMTSGTLMQSAWFEETARKVVHFYQQYGCSEVGCIAMGGGITSVNDVGVPLSHLHVIAGSCSKNPDEIKVTTSDGSIIETRDFGYLDNGGRLHFISRIDDMINVAGLNVYPAEVEEVVLSMPGIRDAVVFKRSHSFGNDQVCLQYVADTKLAAEDIRAWCRQQLANYQVPIDMTQVEYIDRLPSGKISRKKLANTCSDLYTEDDFAIRRGKNA